MDLAGKRNEFWDQKRKKHIERLFRDWRIQQRFQQMTLQEPKPTQFDQAIINLPHSIHQLASLVSNQPTVLPRLLEAFPKLVSTLSQATSDQWELYIELLQILIGAEQNNRRTELIQQCIGLILSKSLSLFSKHKFSQTTKKTLELIANLKDSICGLSLQNINQVTLLINQNFRVLNKQAVVDIMEPLLSICNNILSRPLGENPLFIQPNYKFKKVFLDGLLKNKLVVSAFIELCLAGGPHTGDIVKFLINFLYCTDDSACIEPYLEQLTLMIVSYLQRKQSLSSYGWLLLLTLINNLAVSSVDFCNYLLQKRVAEMMIELFGEEENYLVMQEFISTLSVFVITSTSSKKMLEYLLKINCHSILIGSLQKIRGQPIHVEKCLEAITVLNSLEGTNEVRFQLLGHRDKLQYFMINSQNLTILNFCEALLSALHFDLTIQ